MKGKVENCKLKKYKDKTKQSEVYEKLDEESSRWLQCSIEPKKVASVIAVPDGGNKGMEGKQNNKESAIRTNARRVTQMYFFRIAAVNGLPNFVRPNDPLSPKGEHIIEIPLQTPTSRFLLSVIGDNYSLYFIIHTSNFKLGLLTE